ncbi:hypothetical protein [Thiohalobacter thiocyanaticus]|uniref:hypothetical protein n=1 Tax=Thiohalobacter thiocyanaticus TaxID=585455 RepID=UPI000F63E025|nr:hypothetical protein [Thiohalobacter thiocyanaticus]
MRIAIILLLAMFSLSGCSGKYEAELDKLVETYNKVKKPINIDELTSRSLRQNYVNIKNMDQANIWLRHDASHFNTAIAQSLEKEKKEKESPLNSVKLEGTILKQQAIMVSVLLEEFYDKNVKVKVTGNLDIYAVPTIKSGNVVFTIVASDLSLKRLHLVDKDFTAENDPLTVALVDETINALLPYLSNLIPEANVFDKSFRLADINPADLFEGIRCMKPSGEPRRVVADVVQSAVVVSPSGIDVIAFAASRLIQPEDTQVNLISAQHSTRPIPTAVLIAEEVAALKARSFDANDSKVQDAFKQPNYAIAGDFLIESAFNLLGDNLDYSVAGTPCVEPIPIDTKIEASKVSENCKRIANCRDANSNRLTCDSADNCKNGLHCPTGCKWHQLDCHARKAACETQKSARILACYTVKGVSKGVCETIKTVANTACAAVNAEELLNYPVDCGIGATLGADNMGHLTGTLEASPKESIITIERVVTTSSLDNLQAVVKANLATQIAGNVKLTPTGPLGSMLTCTLPTVINVKHDATFDGYVVLNASMTGIEVNDDNVSTHHYKLHEAKLKVKLDKSILEGLLLRNPHFIEACPGATLIGLIDSATGGDSGKNTMELKIDATIFDVEVQPIIWKYRDIDYRVPVVIGRMKPSEN